MGMVRFLSAATRLDLVDEARVLYVSFSDRSSREHFSMFFVVEDVARKLESKKNEEHVVKHGLHVFVVNLDQIRHPFRSFRGIQKKSLTIVMKVSYNNWEPCGVEW